MFTEEKLLRWISTLADCLEQENYLLKQIKDTSPVYGKIVNKSYNLSEMKCTFEQLYTTMTSEGSI